MIQQRTIGNPTFPITQNSFSKRVWYDSRHQAEVFVSADGVTTGTIVSYKGGLCAINPRPELLLALYQEARIKRILSLRGIILTDTSPELMRGLCTVVNYARAFRRKRSLAVITHSNTSLSVEFISSSCSRLARTAEFGIEVRTLETEETTELGEWEVAFEPTPAGMDAMPMLRISTQRKTLHYFDESHSGGFDEMQLANRPRPNLIIRSGDLLRCEQIPEGEVSQ